MKKITTIAILLAFFGSCAPTSKEQYLESYKLFIEEVSENGKNFTEKEWEVASKKFTLFSNEWYYKFKHELTLEEKIRVAGYKIRYNLIKAGGDIGKLYEQNAKGDVEELKAKLQYYIDNKMEDDIKIILEETKKISNDLYNELKKIIDDINADKECE